MKAAEPSSSARRRLRIGIALGLIAVMILYVLASGRDNPLGKFRNGRDMRNKGGLGGEAVNGSVRERSDAVERILPIRPGAINPVPPAPIAGQ